MDVVIRAGEGLLTVQVGEDEVPHILYDGLRITLVRAQSDGVRLVQIDSDGLPEDAGGPRLRCYLNDGPPLYENPAYVAPEE